MHLRAAGLSIEPSLAPSAHDVVRDALAAERCVILDGETGAGHAHATADVLAGHRGYVRAGCDVVTTDSRGLLSPLHDGGRHAHWPALARRAVRLAREAIAREGRDGEVAVAFSLDADVDRTDAAETIRLLDRALADEPPDLLLVEGLAVLGPTLHATVDALLALELPVWLSFRRCRHGLCGVYGQHWGGPEGDAFGRAAQRFQEQGVEALLLGCIPPDHVDGTLAHLRDFTDLPLGVQPNLGYLTSDGWHVDADSGPAEFARMAVGWRREGAQLIGGCCGVGPERIGAARAALAGRPRGAPRPRDGGPHELGGAAHAAPPEPWVDGFGHSLYPLAFPDLVVKGEVFAPSQGSFLIWRHLLRERVGAGARCLDIGCGTGLQAIQLALNGAAHVDAIDLEPDATETTLVNAFRNGVVDRVSATAVDLFAWRPQERYDVIVASLYQLPVNPSLAGHGHRPADFWGRNAIDHLIRLLPHALADGGLAYVLQISLLSQERTAELVRRRGLQARVVDFGLLPITDGFLQNADQVARVVRMSDAHYLDVCGTDVLVGYLLEIGRR